MRKDFEIKVESTTSFVYLNKKVAGINFENLQGNFIVKFLDSFVDGVAWLEYDDGTSKGYLAMTKVGETYTLPILSSLLKKVGQIKLQIRITEGNDPDNIPVWKSNIFYIEVKEALNTTTEIPDEYAEWIDIANEKISEIDTMDIDIVTEDNDSKVVITRKDGTTKEASLGGAVSDVQKNGVSVVENGIANIIVPTKTSDLTNDSGYITGYTETDPVFSASPASGISSSDISSWSCKQEALVSGTNIKTINNESILGSGNITIQGGGSLTDVQINGTSITSGGTANIVTKGTYNASTNKIATESDLPSVPTNISAFTNDAGYLTSETDPVFSASAAAGIQSSDIISWDAKGTYSKPSGGIPKSDLDDGVQTSLGKADSAVQDVSGKQDKSDNTLDTTSKTVVGAINEVNSVAKGATQALGLTNYQSMVSWFNLMTRDIYRVGQNVYIQTLNVPDLWISSVESTSTTYTYTTDNAIVSALETDGYIQIGYYRLSVLETQKVDLTNYVQKSKIKTTTSTTAGDIYDVTYINTMIGNVETLLSEV